MQGREPDEQHRVATPLELIFDLTFVVAISLCGSHLAQALAAGHVGGGILGFAFGMFGILWAWMGYTWFASAFDTDDWAMRIATLVQMVGVLVLGLGQRRSSRRSSRGTGTTAPSSPATSSCESR